MQTGHTISEKTGRASRGISPKTRHLLYKTVTFLLVTAAFVFFYDWLTKGSLSGFFGMEDISRKTKGYFVPICAWVVAAISLNLVVGFSGELSLGHAGFMSIGYSTGIVVYNLLTKGYGWDNIYLAMAVTLAAAGVTAGIVGFLVGIPVLRLRGDYLAIVTLACAEIVKSLLQCLYVGLDTADGVRLQFAFPKNTLEGGKLTLLLKGPTASAAIGTKGTTTDLPALYIISFALVILTLLVVFNLTDSRTGRAIKSTRENRIAAEAMGIPVTRHKMIAFVTASVLAGMAGALLANKSTYQPANFNLDMSIMVLVYVVLGGLGNVLGSIFSTTVLYILPEELRFMKDYRMLVYALVLIFAMVLTNNPVIKRWVTSFVGLFKRRKHMTLFAEEARNPYGKGEGRQEEGPREVLVVEEEPETSEAPRSAALQAASVEAEPERTADSAVEEALPEPEASRTAPAADVLLPIGPLYTADGTPLDEDTLRRIALGLKFYEAYGEDGVGKQRKSDSEKAGKDDGKKAKSEKKQKDSKKAGSKKKQKDRKGGGKK